MSTRAKNWDRHVIDAEEVARTAGFLGLRDEIVRLAAVSPGEVVADVGAGTGLLALALADDAGRVWALDISSGMCDYLTAKAESAELENVKCVVASAVSLPLVDASVDVVVSNYCFHHVDDDGKRRALAEIHRILRPGGRLVFGDMMFRVSVGDPRDREVLAAKVRAMVAKGPGASGVWSRTALASPVAAGSTRRRPNGGGRRSSGPVSRTSPCPCSRTRVASPAPAKGERRRPVPREALLARRSSGLQ